MPFTVASWNIQNTSLRKMVDMAGNSSGFGEYVGALLAADNPAVAGLMEVRQGAGDVLAPLLARINPIAIANGAAAAVWQGRVSAQQDDRVRKESSIYLWNTTLAVPSTTAMPGPFFSINVIDMNAMQNVFALGGVAAPADVTAATTWLTTGGQPWTHFAYQPRNLPRLNAAALTWLKANAAIPGASAPPAPPNGSDATAYAAGWHSTLLGIDFLWFPTLGDRSPFVGQFTAPGGGGAMLTTALLHAPNPTDRGVGSAANIMAQSVTLNAAATLVVMGDFNIKHVMINDDYPLYDLGGGAWTANGTAISFEVLTTAPFSATRQMGWTDTSLSSRCPTPTTTSPQARSEPYDMFLTKGAAATATYAALDLLDAAVAPANLLEQDMVRYAEQTLMSSVSSPQLTWSEWFDDKIDKLDRLSIRAAKKVSSQQNTITKLSAITAPTPVQQQRLVAAQAKLVVLQAAVDDFTDQITAYQDLQTKLGGGGGAYTVPTAWVLIRRGVADHLPILASGV